MQNSSFKFERFLPITWCLRDGCRKINNDRDQHERQRKRMANLKRSPKASFAGFWRGAQLEFKRLVGSLARSITSAMLMPKFVTALPPLNGTAPLR